MNYSSLRRMDISNGTGIRVSLFVSGCNFHCPDCFNQESQSFEYGKPYTEDTCGTILNLVSNPYVSGLSILGGDPLWQDETGLKELITLANLVHTKPNKTVWLWSGFTWEEIMQASNESSTETQLRRELVKTCDIFVDGRFDKNLKDLTLKWRGSSNQRVIDVQQSLANNKIILLKENN